MGWRDRVKIAGKPSKRFRVWRTDIDDKPYVCEAEYDTVEELNAYRWRLDWDYRIEVGKQFMTRREFADWAQNKGPTVVREVDKTRVTGHKKEAHADLGDHAFGFFQKTGD